MVLSLKDVLCNSPMQITGLITGDPKIKMQYKTSFRDITVKHAIALRNWPHTSLKSPGSMGHSLPAITKLLDLVTSGEVYFEALEADELQELIDEEEERIASGEVVVTSRKTRKDAGRKRGDERSDSDSDEPPSKKARTSVTEPTTKKASSKKKKTAYRSASLVASDAE